MALFNYFNYLPIFHYYLFAKKTKFSIMYKLPRFQQSDHQKYISIAIDWKVAELFKPYQTLYLI